MIGLGMGGRGTEKRKWKEKRKANAEARSSRRSAEKRAERAWPLQKVRAGSCDQGLAGGLTPGLVISFSASAMAWAAGISAPDLLT